MGRANAPLALKSTYSILPDCAGFGDPAAAGGYVDLADLDADVEPGADLANAALGVVKKHERSAASPSRAPTGSQYPSSSQSVIDTAPNRTLSLHP